MAAQQDKHKKAYSVLGAIYFRSRKALDIENVDELKSELKSIEQLCESVEPNLKHLITNT